MFFKRSLVMVVGVLLFIGAFILYFRVSDARLEDGFRKERAKFGVDGTVLTLAIASPQNPPAPAPAAAAAPSAPAAPSTDAAPGPASPTDSTPAPITPPDQTVIPAPMPSDSTPDAAPVPAPDPMPAPDTNNGSGSGPMMPPSSGMNEPRPRRGSPLITKIESQIVSAALAQVTNPVAAPSSGMTNAMPPAQAATPLAGETGETNLASPRSSATQAPAAVPRRLAGASVGSMHSPMPGGRAIVLGYHQFTGPGIPSKNPYSMSQDVFISEMKYLRDNGFHVVPLSDVVAFIEHKKELPQNAVAITIDDGYKSALNYAAPVLKEFGYPWTYFVYPQFITRTEGKGAASWPDLLELDREGVDVESHSMTHPKLTSHKQTFPEGAAAGEGVAPIEQYGHVPHILSAQEYDDFLTNETSGAKAILEKELGKKIKYFAYPYGAYNKQVEAKAVAAGYEAIFTVAGNPVHITTDIHSVGRYIITKPDEPRFAGYLHQGVLGLTDAEPAPGAIITNPRPVITAVLGFNGSPASLETEVDGLGVAHDFDPQTSTVRLYLARDLIQPENMVSIRAKDAQSGQTMAANWHFNYEPATGSVAPAHEPAPSPGMKAGSNAVNSAAAPVATTPMAKPTPIASPATTTTAVTNAPAKSAPTTP